MYFRRSFSLFKKWKMKLNWQFSFHRNRLGRQGLGSVYQETRAQATSNFVCHCCWLLHCTLWRCLWTLCSLLAEALFMVFVDGRKETSAMGRKCLWFNRRPQSWTALFETHAPSVVRWPQLAPVGSRSILYIDSAVIYWAHIVNMACSSAFSKEFNRKELQNLLSSVLDNLNDGKVKKWSDKQFKAPFHFLNGRDTFACLPIGHWLWQ